MKDAPQWRNKSRRRTGNDIPLNENRTDHHLNILIHGVRSKISEVL